MFLGHLKVLLYLLDEVIKGAVWQRVFSLFRMIKTSSIIFT